VTGQPAYEGTLSQPLNVATGTYVFGAWILAEDSILLTNFHMEIEWLKKDLTASQPATVASLTLPLDNTWHYYAITGTCGNADLFEVRPLFRAQWNENLGAGNKAIKLDDVTFGPPGAGDLDGDGIPDAWEMQWSGTATGVQANADQDGDTLTGGEEYILDYDPISASNSPFALTDLATGSFSLTFGATAASRVYTVDYNADLTNGTAWAELVSGAAGSNGVVTITDTNDAIRRSYRVRVHTP
jgi:hypothetical protein